MLYLKAAKGWDEGEEGNLLEKVSLFPLELPHHPCQNFLFRSMRLYRSAPGSHPAPVPRCCGRCTVEGRAALPCRHVRVGYASCSGQTAQSSFRKAAGNRLGAGTGRRKRDKGSGQPFRLPGHDGQPPGTANSLDKSCAMVCHKSRKLLFFWAGACGRRRHPSWAKGGTGAFPHSGKNPMGWFRERRKKVVEREEAGL